MPKMVILGAGASKACKTNRPDLPMPLLRDLPSVFERFDPKTGQRDFGQKLRELLEITRGDIEVLLTFFYRLNDYFFAHSPVGVLERPFIERIRASGALPYYFPSADECQQADNILERLYSLADPSNALSTSFAPGNFFTLFQGSLHQYCQASFQSYPCPLHKVLFSHLHRFDTVVSFNYDQIADYTLRWLGKLTPYSFQGLGFSAVILPEWGALNTIPVPDNPHIPRDINDRVNAVTFLKVHGSFNWWSMIDEQWPRGDDWTHRTGGHIRYRQSTKGGPEVIYSLDQPPNVPNATLAPVIFPFLAKELVYRSNPMFERHLVAFQYELSRATEVYLVGKTFDNADRDLNAMIRFATSEGTGRILHIIDPKSSDADFARFHCSLFHADPAEHYAALEAFEEQHDAN